MRRPMLVSLSLASLLLRAGPPPFDAAGEIRRLGAEDFQERQEAERRLCAECARLDREKARATLRPIAEGLIRATPSEDLQVAAAAARILAPYRAGAPLLEHISLPRCPKPIEREGSLILWQPHSPRMTAVSMESAKVLWERTDLQGLRCLASHPAFLVAGGAKPERGRRPSGWLRTIDPATGKDRVDLSEGLPGEVLALADAPEGTYAWGVGKEGDWIGLLPKGKEALAWTVSPARAIEPGWERCGSGSGEGIAGVGYRSKDGSFIRWLWSPLPDATPCLLPGHDDPNGPDAQGCDTLAALSPGTGKPLWRIESPSSKSGGSHGFSRGAGGEIISYLLDRIQRIDAGSGKILWEHLSTPEAKLQSHLFAPSGRVILSESMPDGGGRLLLLDPARKDPILERKFQDTAWIHGTPAGKETVVVVNRKTDRTVLLLDPEAGSIRWEAECGLGFAPIVLERCILSVGTDDPGALLRPLDMETGKLLGPGKQALPGGFICYEALPQGVILVGVDPDSGGWASLVSPDGRIRWTAKTGLGKSAGWKMITRSLERTLVISAWGPSVPSAGRAALLDRETGKILLNLEIPGRAVWCRHQGDALFLGGESRTPGSNGSRDGSWVGLYRLRDAWEEPEKK